MVLNEKFKQFSLCSGIMNQKYFYFVENPMLHTNLQQKEK